MMENCESKIHQNAMAESAVGTMYGSKEEFTLKTYAELFRAQNLDIILRTANGTSYNRTKYIAQRFQMIQQWADYLDRLAAGGDVIQFKAA